jgi:hypothetical protein
MTITINREQRDALWGDIELDHSGLGDLATCLSRGEAADAQEMRRRFDKHWRLLDDLGWTRGDPRREFTLTMPPGEIAEAMQWHRERVIEALPDSEDPDQDLDILSACDRVLEQVGS